jgi:hypothetical protein
VFIKILCNKINYDMEEKKQWSKYQTGFKTDCRTEDNYFIINTAISKYMENSKKVYAAFIDFSKFFDTINRDMLLYKLIKYKVNSNIYNVIKDMYSECLYTIKSDQKLSEKFLSSTGVKQGCNLSPVLSNLYQNDLYSIFDNTCDPLVLNETKINALSFADDLVLLSETKEGLQKCLNKLEQYCYKWGLSLNTKKTKCMVFNKKQCNNSGTVFTYKNEILEIVKEYTYLGFKLTSNNNTQNTMKDRIIKANRVVNVLRRALYTNGNSNVKVALSLFDKQAVPVLCYGASVWGVPLKTNYVYVENIPMNVKDVKGFVNEKFKEITGKCVDVISCRKLPNANNLQRAIVNLKNCKEKEQVLFRNGNILSVKNYDICLDKSIYESVQSQFCKFVTNVSKYASNRAILGELGRTPLYIKILKYCVKYWCRLENGTKNRLLNETYQFAKLNETWWVQGIHNVLRYNGFGNVLTNNSTVTVLKTLPVLFENRLTDCYIQGWYEYVRESKTLCHLAVLKETYKMSNYLTTINNVSSRKIITKLRTGAHKLDFGTMTDKSATTCTVCNSGYFENVEHILLSCKYTNSSLTELHNKIEKLMPTNCNNIIKLRFLLNFEVNNSFIGYIIKYITTISNARGIT